MWICLDTARTTLYCHISTVSRYNRLFIIIATIVLVTHLEAHHQALQMSNPTSTKKSPSSYNPERDGTLFHTSYPDSRVKATTRSTYLPTRQPPGSVEIPSFRTGLTPKEQSQLPKEPKWSVPPEPSLQEKLEAFKARIAERRKARESAASQASSETA
jgi:hypothetical protein